MSAGSHGIADEPAPDSAKCKRCGARTADEAATMCKPMGDDCPGVAMFDGKPAPESREADKPVHPDACPCGYLGCSNTDIEQCPKEDGPFMPPEAETAKGEAHSTTQEGIQAMTITPEVPMPEPVGSTTYFDMSYGEEVVRAAYTADQVRDTAIKYADARCAALQAELAGAYARAENAEEWREELQAERDALAEKVKAMEDNDRRYRWLRDQFDTYITCGNRAVAGFFLKDDYEIPDGTVGDRDAKFDAAIDAAGDQP